MGLFGFIILWIWIVVRVFLLLIFLVCLSNFKDLELVEKDWIMEVLCFNVRLLMIINFCMFKLWIFFNLFLFSWVSMFNKIFFFIIIGLVKWWLSKIFIGYFIYFKWFFLSFLIFFEVSFLFVKRIILFWGFFKLNFIFWLVFNEVNGIKYLLFL